MVVADNDDVAGKPRRAAAPAEEGRVDDAAVVHRRLDRESVLTRRGPDLDGPEVEDSRRDRRVERKIDRGALGIHAAEPVVESNVKSVLAPIGTGVDRLGADARLAERA